jgi:hypothetical protein
MRWERWTGDEGCIGTWTIEVIDTSNLVVEQVATQVLGWCRRALAGKETLLVSHPTAEQQ